MPTYFVKGIDMLDDQGQKQDQVELETNLGPIWHGQLHDSPT
jgi:hypothetical protein